MHSPQLLAVIVPSRPIEVTFTGPQTSKKPMSQTVTLVVLAASFFAFLAKC